MISLPSALVVDANVILSAIFGRRARDVFVSQLALACHAPMDVAAEVARHLPALTAKRGLDLETTSAALRFLPVTWHAPETYDPFRAEAERRIAARDPDDWPVVALALALDLPVWTQDKDFAEAGLLTFTTGQLLALLRAQEGG